MANPNHQLGLTVNKNGSLEDLFYKKLSDNFKSYFMLKKPIPRYLINQVLSQFRFNLEKIDLILFCLESKGMISIKKSGFVNPVPSHNQNSQ